MFYFKLEFGPDWDDIVIIRKFIISILSQKLTTDDEAYRIALVASELLENACRYSTIGKASIELEQVNDKDQIECRIKNITKKENIEEFKKIFDLINSGSAAEAYKNMMLRIISRKDNKLSQLGLARIRYEGHSELTYEIESDLNQLVEGTVSSDNVNQNVILSIRSKMSITQKKNGESNGI